jgi:hypothetical protein
MIPTHDNLDTATNYIKIHPHNMRALLLAEAMRWVGVTEQGEDNKGQLVEMFQRSVNLAPEMPWCAAFVHFCIQAVEKQAKALDMYSPSTRVERSGHVMTIWENTPLANRVSALDALPGDLVLWNVSGTQAGHIGIMLANNRNGTFKTVEGNTTDSAAIEREGDCVAIKNRLAGGYGSTRVMGFIRVWL